MSLPTSFVLCCVLGVGCLLVSQRNVNRRPGDEWLQAQYSRATSVKVGMSRTDLLKEFRMDGGLQPLGIPTRYILRGTSLIKVDVEFEKPPNAKGLVVPEDLKSEMETPLFDVNGRSVEKEKYELVSNDDLKIKSISRPYLEPFNYD